MKTKEVKLKRRARESLKDKIAKLLRAVKTSITDVSPSDSYKAREECIVDEFVPDDDNDDD